VEW
jgi:hypothetical protein